MQACNTEASIAEVVRPWNEARWILCCVVTDAPRLCDIDVADDKSLSTLLKSFVCHSVPVTTKARLDHASELRLVKQPWWRKLGDQYQDSKYCLEDDRDDCSWKVF